MAAKRFVKSSIDWAAFAERVPSAEKIKFQTFKVKVDGYTKKLLSYPEKPPTIDFASYKARLPNLAMVDEFEKQFKAVKVPFPADKLTPLIEEQEKKIDGQIKLAQELADLNCKYYEKKLQWLKDMMPFDEMTLDDYKDYFPDPKLDVYETPNFWPFAEPPRPVFPYLEEKEHH
ncbi:ATP synthase subunit d, mitochondrial [Trichonephila clavata]|uniref:ATP synthase subunit d, mitochondrial n=1 Tax=Trichonephila clavata TaxID=2740835 RepID=A0A8X6FZA2_TRICU|nr:ATP synthase subunit d, mitochondrial [Trichonephila clavata]